MGKSGRSVSCNHEQSDKENVHGGKNCSVTQHCWTSSSPRLCTASSDKLEGEDVCSSPRYSWVSEVQAVYPWLTGPPHPYDGFMAALGKTRLSLCDIFKMLSGCADVQTKLHFYFQTFAVICGHSSVWWGVHKRPPPRRTV